MSKINNDNIITIGKNNLGADFNTANFANDSVCFQAAIDRMAVTGGGTVKIFAGNYTMANIVNYKSNVNIDGDGLTTVINQSVNFTQKLANIQNVKISNILIDAINMTAGNFYGIYMENVIDVILDNVKVINAKGFAIFCGASISGLTEHVRFLNCHLEGLGTSDVLGGGPAGGLGLTTGSVRNIVVDNCRVFQNSLVGNFHKDAINFVKAENIKITNCTTKGSILWGSEQGPHLNSIISKNTVYNAGGTSRAVVGLVIDSAVPSAGGNILIEGNIIKDGFIDIFNNIVGSKLNFLKISGNTIKGTGLTAANNEFAILLVNVDQSTIVDNTIEQSNTGGIKLINSQYNNIFLNKINSTQLFGYQETGTSNHNVYELNTNFNNVQDIDTATLGANTKVNAKLTSNTAIVGSTRTKISYDNNGLVTAGVDATGGDIITTPITASATQTAISGTTVQTNLSSTATEINKVKWTQFTTTTITGAGGTTVALDALITPAGYNGTSRVLNTSTGEIWDKIAGQTAWASVEKIASNGVTNLSLDAANSGTVLQINSDTGADVVLPIASATLAGIITNVAQNITGAKSFNTNGTFFGTGISTTTSAFTGIGNLGTNNAVYMDARSSTVADVNIRFKPLGLGKVQFDNIANFSEMQFGIVPVTISALTVGTSATLFTVPTTRTLILTKVFFRPTTVTGTVTTAPSLSVGSNATTFDDFMPTTQLTGGVTLARGFVYNPQLSSMPIYPAGAVVTVQVDTAQVGATALTYTIDLFGYFI